MFSLRAGKENKLTGVLLAGVALLLVSCASTDTPRFKASGSDMPTQVQPFADYLTQTTAWLEDNRLPVTDKPQWEVSLNAPFECGTGSDVGLLLVHGLGDSPYFFHDVAQDLCQQGVWVRTILLPGHSSRPGNMLDVRFEDWRDTTDYHISQFENEVDTLLLGGFSTGANLVSLSAVTRRDIAGLVLFSPAFDSRFSASWFAPYLTGIYPWPNVEKEDNPTRYNSMAMNGFAAYQGSVAALKEALERTTITIPVMMVVAEGDSVVDVDYVADQFATRFTHPDKHLMWLGDSPPAMDNLSAFPMDLPDRRIGAASHMSPLFSPGNVLYGQKGRLRICDNGQGEEKTRQCRDGDPVWYGPWGLTHPDRVYARLTYNPYYQQMLRRLKVFIAELD
ncbi:alpha/beta hydrolase [Alteromonas halophila]|uniref:Lipoprotein n=1 Tax=Alteromonas halophila TaxID=516698 RepID=A0A918JCH8_9ALTE|nr:alpha/beta fold hydrolase [Alteromonas halophila]GGW74671.1 lipoprotein [Alteromonas halophila]